MAGDLRRIGQARLTPRAHRSGHSLRPSLEGLEGRELLTLLPPTGLTANGVSASAIALAWSPSKDPAVTGYEVYEKIWIRGIHNPRGSGGTPGHYAYNLIGSKLTTPSDTVPGLAAGSTHTYVVTALSASGQSPYSAEATAETWVAPGFPNGPNTFLLSSGALFSGSVSATAGLTTQLSLLVSGNPLTFTVLSGPRTVSIDPRSGVVTYTPAASEAGAVPITFKASNPLGSVTQTILFNVSAQDPKLASPRLSLYATSSAYTGQYQQVAARAVGTDGGTPVGGTFSISYNGGRGGAPHNAGTYPVLVSFTSADPHYGNATLLTTYTITKATPAFNSLASPTIASGTARTTVSGTISAGPAVPAGESVIVTLNGVSQLAPVAANGSFATSFATGGLPVGTDAITYQFPADANFNAAPIATSTLRVIPTAPPRVTTQPTNITTTAGDSAIFTAAAVGSPMPSVQWQVSSDGGKTFVNIAGNTSALTTTLVFVTTLGQNGYKYRAVFSNSVGSVTTEVVGLTVESDSGGNG